MTRIELNGIPVPWRESPNWTKRAAGVPITGIVLHSTGDKPHADSVDGPVNWLCDPVSKASAHCVIGRDGSITQLVDLDRQAWHAGRSMWPVSKRKVNSSVNAFTIGIEMEHVDGVENWPGKQLEVAAAVVAWMLTRYNIGLGAVVGHCDVAPRRKVDPQAFPWSEFRALVLFRLRQTKAVPALVGPFARVDGRLIEDRLFVPARLGCAALGILVGGYEPRNQALDCGGTALPGRMVGNVLYVPARRLCEIAKREARWDAAQLELTVSP